MLSVSTAVEQKKNTIWSCHGCYAFVFFMISANVWITDNLRLKQCMLCKPACQEAGGIEEGRVPEETGNLSLSLHLYIII